MRSARAFKLKAGLNLSASSGYAVQKAANEIPLEIADEPQDDLTLVVEKVGYPGSLPASICCILA